MQQEQLKAAYTHCRGVTQRSSKTFYWGSLFLPPPKRHAVWVIYAFCRVVDDIVDELDLPGSPRIGHLSGSVSPGRELDHWREALTRLYQRGYADPSDQIQFAWSEMLKSYDVPLEPALELLQGVAMDLTINRYDSFEELYLYCYRVAGTVGLLTSPIFGFNDQAALEHAVDLGIALQLTNILRDVGEDSARNRIYLPQKELQRFEYSEADLFEGVINDSFRELVRFQMERAEEYYLRAQPGISLLSSDCRVAIRLSSALYRGILDRIRLNNYNVFTKRASVPLKNKLAAASQYWFIQQVESMGERMMNPYHSQL